MSFLLSVATPEQVTLEYEVAGLGSRFTAALVDGLVQSTLVIVLLVVLAASGALSPEPLLVVLERHGRGEPDALAQFMTSRLAIAGMASFFGMQIAYHALFEGLREGQTPGKRLMGVRVVADGGFPLGPAAALMRNVFRPIDFLPVFFGLGLAFALVTRRTQRLGDLAARTLVVRERGSETAPSPAPPQDPARQAADLVSQLSADEATLVRLFLERRDGLDSAARKRLAERIAHGLMRRHGDAGSAGLSAEGYLERLARGHDPT